MSLYRNINRRKKLGISRSKKKSTISKKNYDNMKKGFKKSQVAKQKFTTFTPREKPKKRKGVHTKSQNKSSKRQKKQTRYKGQGR